MSMSKHQEPTPSRQGCDASDDRFLALAQESADVFWLLTPEGEMQESCPSWHTFTRQEKRSCLGRGWLSALHPADQSQLEATLRQCVSSGQTTEIECHLRRDDGTYHLVHLRAIPVRAASGALREIIVCGTNLTRREPTEKMSDAQVQLAVQASGVGMWDWDCRTDQLVWTEQMKALFGLPPDAPISYERFLAAVHSDDRERIDHLHVCDLEKAQEYRREYRAVWPDGSVHWLASSVRSIAHASGKPLHVMGATVDMTELKHAEERLTAVLDTITDAFLHVDTKWRVTYLNREAERYLSLSVRKKDVLGKNLWEIAPFLLGTSIEPLLRDAMATLQARDFDVVGPRQQRWFEVHVCPASDGLSIYFHDIDERKQAEAALRQSKEELHLLTDTMPQLVWIAQPDGFVDFFNQLCYTYLDATREELMGDRWVSFLHPEDRHRVLTHWQRALQTGQGYEIEFRLREGMTGNYHWFLARATPLTDEQGRVLKWFGTCTDIDQEKQATEALRQSRDAFRLLTEALPQLVWTSRPDGFLEYANQRWYTYTGNSVEQTLGEGWIACYHPDDQHKVLTLWQTSLLTNHPFEVEARLHEGKTGAYRWFLIRGVPLSNTSGRVWKWLGTCTDIHAKKCTEEALQESEVRFRRLMQSNIIGITVIDLEGPILEANDAFLALLGYTRQDLVEGRLNWRTLTSPEHQDPSTQAVKEVLATGMAQLYEKEYLTKSGKRVPVLVGTVALRRAGPTQLAMSFVLDLTARKAVEEQREASHRQVIAILESITNSFVHVDPQWRYTYVNRRAEEYAGKSRDEMVGQRIWDVYPELLGTPTEHQMREAMETQQVKHFEAWESQRQRWAEIHAYPAQDGLSVYSQDITERKHAEEALRESEARFRALVESNLIGITIADLEGTIQEANDAFLALVGYTQEEVAARQVQWTAMTPPEYQERDTQAIEELRTSGMFQPFEKVYVAKDGTRVPVLLGGTCFHQRGSELLALCFIVDLTARYKAEEQLQEAHQRITTILESITDAFFHVDTQWCYTYVNRGVEKMLDKKREEIVGQTLWDMVPEALGTPFEQVYREAMATQQTRHIEGFHPSFQRWLEIHLYPTPDGLSVYSQDITERKHAEEALRESEARFRALVDANLLGITISDLSFSGTIREANDAFLALVGYTQEDVATGQMQWAAMTPPEYQEQHKQVLEELLTTGMVQPFEKEVVKKDGTRVPVLVGRTLFRKAGSEPLVIGFVLDQTADKEMERQKDLMLSMTSHELKTPLAALKGTFQLLQRRVKRLSAKTDDLSPEVRAFFPDLIERLAASARQVDVQTHLINDLLDVSRITANTLKLELDRCDLVSLVHSTVEDLRVTAPARSLVLEVPEDTTVMVLADRARISQVVANYLTNAIRYSPPDRPIHIGLTIGEDVVRVWVRDKGPGLTEEARNNLWQRFHQVKGVPVQNGSGKGLGLGLYICQTLIAQHQGEVGVESTPGEGSTFWFTLPMAKASVGECATTQQSTR